MNTRRQFLAAFAAIIFNPEKVVAADEFYVKVLRVNRAQEEVEIELATQPKQTKVLFHGEVGSIFDGEYVRLQVHNDWKLGGKPMKVESITWVF